MSEQKTKGKNNTGENIPVYSIHCLSTNHPLSLFRQARKKSVPSLRNMTASKMSKVVFFTTVYKGISTSIRILNYRSVTTIIGHHFFPLQDTFESPKMICSPFICKRRKNKRLIDQSIRVKLTSLQFRLHKNSSRNNLRFKI